MVQHCKDADCPVPLPMCQLEKAFPDGKQLSFPACLSQSRFGSPLCSQPGAMGAVPGTLGPAVFVKSWSWPMGNGDIRQGRRTGSWG